MRIEEDSDDLIGQQGFREVSAKRLISDIGVYDRVPSIIERSLEGVE